MLAKLEDSTVTAKDRAVLGFEPLTATDVASKLPGLTFHRAGFKIPYYRTGTLRSFTAFVTLNTTMATALAS
jgi:hypothetical protein